MKVWLRGHRICWRKVKGGESGQFNALDVELPQRKTQHNHHGHHWQHHHSHHYHHHHHHDWPAKLWLNPLQPALPWRQIASIIPHPPEIHFNMDTFINPLDIHSSPEIHPPSWDTFTLLKHIYPCDMPIWRGQKKFTLKKHIYPSAQLINTHPPKIHLPTYKTNHLNAIPPYCMALSLPCWR